MNIFLTRQSSLLLSIYFGGVISYNIFTIYSNGSEQLLEYRKKKETFKTETESIVVGIQKNWFDNLLLSFFWPLRLPMQIVPMLILNLNSEEDKYESKPIQIKDNNEIIKNERNEKTEKTEINEKNTETKNVIDDKYFNESNTLNFDFSAGNNR